MRLDKAWIANNAHRTPENERWGEQWNLGEYGFLVDLPAVFTEYPDR